MLGPIQTRYGVALWSEHANEVALLRIGKHMVARVYRSGDWYVVTCWFRYDAALMWADDPFFAYDKDVEVPVPTYVAGLNFVMTRLVTHGLIEPLEWALWTADHASYLA